MSENNETALRKKLTRWKRLTIWGGFFMLLIVGLAIMVPNFIRSRS